jgi:hypothetical protein
MRILRVAVLLAGMLATIKWTVTSLSTAKAAGPLIFGAVIADDSTVLLLIL